MYVGGTGLKVALGCSEVVYLSNGDLGARSANPGGWMVHRRDMWQ